MFETTHVLSEMENSELVVAWGKWMLCLHSSTASLNFNSSKHRANCE
jgi:hypothetical protein